ncbi:MAG: M50 family metallopeptidase [Litorimonas sp.]
MSVSQFKPAKQPTKMAIPRLPATQFWGLCVVVFMVLQFPFIRLPVMFLSTWAHEFGHGLGAIITGGRFVELTVFPNFSGVAQTATSSDFSHAMVVVFGLLGPSLLGVFMIALTRAFSLYRLAILALAGLLALSLIWAADGFTWITLGGGAVIMGLIGWKLPDRILLYVAYVIAIALCLSALTGFSYFFIGNAEVAGATYRSDTGVLADLWGGPHWLWGGLMVVLSVAILVVGVFSSDRWARRRPS